MRTVGVSAIGVRSLRSDGKAQSPKGLSIMLQKSKNKNWCWHSVRTVAEMVVVSRLKDRNDC